MTHTTPRRTTVALVLCLLLAAVAHARPPGINDDAPANLRVVHAAHYTIHTDIADRALVDDVAKRMDVMYGLYAKQLSEFKPAADAPPLPVYLFAQQKRYMAFTHYAGTNTAGLFVGGPHSLLTSFLGGQGRDAMRRTLQHEAFHQFAYFTVSKRLPIWLNEGMAQVFEEGIWTGRSFILGQVPPRRIRQLRSDIDRRKLVPFTKFLTVTPKQWSDNLHADLDAGATYYNEAWAVAQFLMEGTNAGYRKHGADFLRKLHALDAAAAGDLPTDAGDDAAGEPAAFKACFPGVPDFQRAFESWVRGLTASNEATLIEKQETLGDFLIAFHDRGQTFPTVAAFRTTVVADQVRMQYTRGAVKYDTDPDPRVYFADLGGTVYAPSALYFERASGAPLPDVVCWPTSGFHVRTHFYAGDDGKAEHEVAIEPVGGRGR